MTRAARITTKETVTLCGCVHDLRASINRDGRQRPKLEDWAREIEPTIGRLLTSSQIEQVVTDCGYSRTDLFAPEASRPPGKIWGELALEIQVLQRHRVEMQSRLDLAEAYCAKLTAEIESLRFAIVARSTPQAIETGGLE
jgi:hypothetical protein